MDRRAAYLLTCYSLYYAILVAAHLTWPEHVGDVFFGAMLMVPPLCLGVVLAGDPSAASWSRGADAESWTGVELRKGLASPYLVAHDIQFEHTNADHVVVGPSGVIVIETKWSSKPWASKSGYDRLRSAARQASGASRLVRNRLADQGIQVNTQPLLVLWGGEIDNWPEDTRIRVVDGVTVVAGLAVQAWARALPLEPRESIDPHAVIDALIRERSQ